MKSGDLCRRKVVTARPDTTLAEVSKLMRKEHVGSVVVVDKEQADKAIGIVTDRDIVIEVVAAGLDAASVTAGEVMTPSPVVTRSDDDALWALKIMRDRGIRRLPVVDKDGHLVGLVALDDLMQYVGTALSDMAQLIGSERVWETARRG